FLPASRNAFGRRNACPDAAARSPDRPGRGPAGAAAVDKQIADNERRGAMKILPAKNSGCLSKRHGRDRRRRWKSRASVALYLTRPRNLKKRTGARRSE